MTDIDTGRDLATRVLASRRGVFCAFAGLGAAGALAACGTADEPSGSGSGDDDNGGGDTGDDGGGTDSGGADGALAETSEVPLGGGLVVDETVIVQPSADEFLAFSAACPHQGTIVNPPDAEGVIVCPNHGSQFDLEGGLVQGPAETGLTEVDITVEDGSIFAA